MQLMHIVQLIGMCPLCDVRSLTDTDGYPSKIAKTVIMGIFIYMDDTYWL